MIRRTSVGCSLLARQGQGHVVRAPWRLRITRNRHVFCWHILWISDDPKIASACSTTSERGHYVLAKLNVVAALSRSHNKEGVFSSSTCFNNAGNFLEIYFCCMHCQRCSTKVTVAILRCISGEWSTAASCGPHIVFMWF